MPSWHESFRKGRLFEFDLLVMDEASQIQPVDALGAVARAKQVVVVGDPKQLPPTAFFAKMTGGGSDDEDDDGGRVADIESVLGLFTARGLPTRMLRWHYRSKHQSLIAVSNRQFRADELVVVRERGVVPDIVKRLKHADRVLEDGRPQRGATLVESNDRNWILATRASRRGVK